MPDLFQLDSDRCQLTWGRRRSSAPPAPESGGGIAAQVLVRPKRGAVRAKWWPTDSTVAIPLEGSGPRLFEQVDYTIFVRSKSEAQADLHHRDPALLRDVRTGPDGQGIGIINFGSQIGRSRFWVDVGGVREFEFEVEVFPTKLDYESDYARIVAEVQEILTGLALEYLRGTFQPGSVVRVPKPSDIEWLTLLKSAAAELEKSLTYVAGHPLRRFVAEGRDMRVDRIHAGNASVRRAISRGRGSGDLRTTSRGRVIHEFLPTQMPWLTLDTPEHRWLASQLRTIRRRLVRLRQAVTAGTARGGEESLRTRQTRLELDDLYARLGRLERLEPMQLAERQLPSSFASLQLLGAPGYREAYKACMTLVLGLHITGGPFEVSTKDLSELYEYWCYLSLLRMLRHELGEPINLRDLIRQDGSALRVQLKKGQSTRLNFRASDRKVSVSYNPEYSGRHLLLAQKPDMLVTIEDESWPPLTLVVDAKYRVKSDADYIASFDSAGPPEDALNVLHRYRDALLESDASQQTPRLKRTVVQAAAMFPYVEATSGAFGGGRLWKSLQTLGVGAIPMLPGHTEYAEAWLRTALSHGGWGLADWAVSHRSSDRAQEWRQAGREPALVISVGDGGVGVSRDRALRIPVVPGRPEQFDVKVIGLATGGGNSWSLGEIVPVVGVRVDAGAVGAQITYHLGASRFRAELHADQGRAPVLLPLWTSRLALDRARRPEELLLRLEAEWRLLEELEALGLDVSLEPMLGDDGQWTWILTPNRDRVRFAGPGGYTVRQPDGSDFVFARLEDVLTHLAAKPDLN